MTPPTRSPRSEKQFSWQWLQARLFPRGTRLLNWASFAVILFVLIEFVISADIERGPSFYATIMGLSVLFILNALSEDFRTLFDREEISTWLFLVITSGLTLFCTWSGQMYSTIYIVLMITAQTHSSLPLRPALAFTTLLAGSWLTVLILLGAGPEVMASIVGGLMIGLTFTITLSQVLYRYSEQTERANHLLDQLQAANAELVAARQREKEMAITEERVRVARDLHDGLGHHLTALSIQLQAVEKLVKTQPDMAAEAAHNARSAVQAALKEVRQSVASLREAPADIQDLPQAIARLVQDAANHTGLQTHFEQQGEAPDISTAAAMTLFRAAQESLTNVQKHASEATRIDVQLVFQAGSIRLSIQDDGSHPDACLPEDTPLGTGRGFGLAGLRERVHLLGGTLECGPAPQGGFRVALTIPVQGDPA
jgi:signal transduction histidine kinase